MIKDRDNKYHNDCVTPEPSNPLPLDIANFIQDAEDGLVLFSLGYTGFEPQDVPRHIIAAFLKVFSGLEQKVIMRWISRLQHQTSRLNTTINFHRFNKTLFSEIPSNVLIVDWLPQHDLLSNNRLV